MVRKNCLKITLKKSHSTSELSLHFEVDKSSFKMPKNGQFGDFQFYSVSRIKLVEHAKIEKIEMRYFG